MMPVVAIVVALGTVWMAHPTSVSRPGFVAYRGPHRIGDLIGPNARVVAVDRHHNPTAVVSTDGRPPVVWAFELAEASSLRPLRGARVRTLDPHLWAHPACPSAMCSAGSPGPRIAGPPPPLPLDACAAVSLGDLRGPLRGSPVATGAGPGACVWQTDRGGIEIELGGPPWWSYLADLPHLYTPVGDHTLVARSHGLRIAVRRGSATAVLLTYTDMATSKWEPIAEEAAAWAASR
ncbi:MAG: hypothetical protein ACYDD7_20410 [Acidimicrobiales bacterium]